MGNRGEELLGVTFWEVVPISILYSLDDLVQKDWLLSKKALNCDMISQTLEESPSKLASLSSLTTPVGQSVPQAHLSLYNHSEEDFLGGGR